MKKILKYLIPTLLCAIAVLAILGARGAFVKSGKGLFYDLCDAFAVPGFITFCLGVLIFATNGGAFDMLAFGFIKLIDLFKRDLTKVKYRTFYDYRQAKSENKRSFLYIMIIGAVYLLIALVFLMVYIYCF